MPRGDWVAIYAAAGSSTHAVMRGLERAWDPANDQIELGELLAGVALVPLEPRSRRSNGRLATGQPT